MNFDTSRSEQDWQRILESEATMAWGTERAAALRPELARTAQALQRIAQRRPQRETVPHREAK